MFIFYKSRYGYERGILKVDKVSDPMITDVITGIVVQRKWWNEDVQLDPSIGKEHCIDREFNTIDYYETLEDAIAAHFMEFL